MDLVMRQDDSIRVKTHQGDTFLDVCGMEWESGLRVTLQPLFGYIEVRAKEGQLAVFQFLSKRHKKETDLGWWQDAEVLIARNDVMKK